MAQNQCIWPADGPHPGQPCPALRSRQDALNAVLRDDRTTLDHIWNVITPFYFSYHDLRLTAAEVDRVRWQARIVHFNGAAKPLSYVCQHPRRDASWHTLPLTPWRDFQPSDRTVFNWLRRLISRLLPGWLKRRLGR